MVWELRNRSFGGLIRDDDPARQRPIENSPLAFDMALQNAASQSNPEGIDGIECDDFFVTRWSTYNKSR